MKLIPALPLALLLAACQHAPAPPSAAAQEVKPAFTLPVPANRQADDAARFLAGLPGQDGSVFKDLEADPAWKAHAAQSDAGWQRFLTKRQPPMREFTKASLAAAEFRQPTLFYPFGGPDIMTAQTFFPAASTYVLVGLEPPGSLPSGDTLRSGLASYLPGVRASLGSILSKSFFITKEMDQQLRGQAADGLLPVMLIELVRNGNTVRGLRYIGLDGEGKWTERTPASPRGQADGVAVEFADAAGATRTLAYFSLNLGDEKYKDNTPFQSYLDRLGPMAAMFKSTSYMPHRSEFSLIRGEVLKRASAVVQDDSGIPFRFFEAAAWQVQLYGAYDQPYGSFKYRQQKDLRDAYAKGEAVGELPFSIGYGFGRMKSNLIVARKKAS